MDCHFLLFLKSWYEKGENLHQGLHFDDVTCYQNLRNDHFSLGIFIIHDSFLIVSLLYPGQYFIFEIFVQLGSKWLDRSSHDCTILCEFCA